MSTPVSVVGTIATDPRLTKSPAKAAFCTFRVASTERRYDREKNQWIDGETNWFTVNAFRSLAENAERSFEKGDRVVVNGRMRVRQWATEEKSGTSVEIDADALGHDLRWGVSRFEKQPRSSAGASVENSPDREEPTLSASAGDSDENPLRTDAEGSRGGSSGDPDATAETGGNDASQRFGEDGFLPLAA